MTRWERLAIRPGAWGPVLLVGYVAAIVVLLVVGVPVKLARDAWALLRGEA